MDEAAFTNRVTPGDDGVYRWYYDLDMDENRSMLYMLLKINLFIFLGVGVAGALFLGFMEGFDAPIVRGVLVVALIMLPVTSLLYVIGYAIAAGVKRGTYRIRFAMDEDGVELVWSDSVKTGYRTTQAALAVTGSLVGSRGVRGRWRPTLDEVSKVAFFAVIRMESYPRWDMIDLSVIGGKFQVYVGHEDYDRVLGYIRERIPERAR